MRRKLERERADREGWRRWSAAILLGILLGSLVPGGEINGQTVDPPAPGQTAAESDPLTTATTELKLGKYSAALAQFRTLLQQNPGEERAQVGLLRGLLETGGYAEAEREARRFLSRPEASAEVHWLLGEALRRTGRDREALAEFRLAARAPAPETRLRAWLREAEMLRSTGEEEAATTVLGRLAEFYEDEVVTGADELTSIAQALVHLERYQQANDLFLEAIAADETWIEAHLGAGELYTSKYNYSEAAEFFADALKINEQSARAHLGIARNRRIGGGEAMAASLARALKINPNDVEAKVLAAAVDLEAERYGSAATQIDEALAIHPRSTEALSLRAALAWLQDRSADQTRAVEATLAIHPRYGMVYEVLGHFATQMRRYRESVAFLRQAVEASPRLWSSHLALGIGLLRLGEMAEGRAALETAFRGDPFNLWAKNTLDLLDSMKEYGETRTGDFLIRTAAEETPVLSGYAGDLLVEARERLSQRYRFTPRAPISVEIFPNHDDFAVRALGLPGLGALGVCFGQVIAQDSPSARAGTPFNWGSTLWHEYAHVITLQMTEHRIPRWFSEGLSVYEEHRAYPGWGDDWTIDHLRAWAEGRWFKISEIDQGFLRPKRPDDIGLAYFQASQICHFIEERYGFEAILAMLEGYRVRKKTPEILREVLKLTEAEFDRAFEAAVRTRIEAPLKALASALPAAATDGTALPPPLRAASGATPDPEQLAALADAAPHDYPANLRAGMAHFDQKNYDRARPYLERAVELFPYQAGIGNPFDKLATIHEAEGDQEKVASALRGWVAYDENQAEPLRRLARWREGRGEKQEAIDLLRQSFYIDPFHYAAHSQAGRLHLDLGQPEKAIRELEVALANRPPNPAEAHFQLGRALRAGGRWGEAKESVLRALEMAPSYAEAQELLLDLIDNPPPVEDKSGKGAPPPPSRN
jgi:tetratricopeptide (TPR) repeat protein